ncbi:helix-turn-helix domain-containing protein [Parasedimentitalea marina]|uniref:helix-turn-helix domain-containing protein n=1 Tax=Parasedimentitalea marina TaxID=2483033 RepID=UPI001EE98E90|nr:helix-turn-helix domain-containing protein [Parasedimentitalea marina]
MTRSAIIVLSRLLDRQNTKTGRCDPSVIRIVEETGMCERSVRGAFKELETRGALKRYRANRRSRNQFMIFSVAELDLHRNFVKQKVRRGAPASLQSVAAPTCNRLHPKL